MESTVSFMQQVLLQQFGLEELRPKQKEIIDCLMNGQHALALLPTGYGKSLCYQLPSQMLPGITLVISPLISLMQDQVSGLERRGIKTATILNSTLSFSQITERIDGIRAGAYKLVYVAPERFESPRFRELLASLRISLLVIDEAHCISQWGHDFRPQYRNLSAHLPRLQDTVFLAVTATATPAVQKDIVAALGLPQMRVVSGGFDRPNLRFEVKRQASPAAKDAYIKAAIKESKDPAIVYTSSKKEAERIAQLLNKGGVKAAAYHAGLGNEQRQRAQRRFEQNEIQAIVATVAFGMGIDKPNIRRVIHNNLPGSLEDYYQQAGRAGRDGQNATCTLLYQPRDIFIQKWLIGKNYPKSEQLTALLALLKKESARGITVADVLKKIDIDDSALNSALDHLRALNAVNLSDAGVYTLEAAVQPGQVDFDKLWQRRKRDESRLNFLVRYAEERECRRSSILSYFGEHLDTACSGCDVCHPEDFSVPDESSSDERQVTGRQVLVARKSGRKTAAKRSVVQIREGVAGNSGEAAAVRQTILQVARQMSGKMGRTSIAGILMGSRAKKILTNGFDKIPEYGTLRGYSEQKLLSCIDDLVSAGFLKVTTGLYPKVFITALAEQNIEARLE